MLLLERTGDAYPDEADPAIRYRLPAALRPAAGPDGTPQVSLTRRPDGGLLHLRLAAQWPPFGPDDRPVLLEDARFRLILRTPASQETGEWRQTPVAGSVLVDRSVPLSRAEAAIARHLGERGEGVVDVEIDAGVRGKAGITFFLMISLLHYLEKLAELRYWKAGHPCRLLS